MKIRPSNTLVCDNCDKVTSLRQTTKKGCQNLSMMLYRNELRMNYVHN